MERAVRPGAARRPTGSPRPAEGPAPAGPIGTPAHLAHLQRTAGNQAVAGLLLPGGTATVQRCGDHPCDCSAEERAEHDTAVQRLTAHADPGPDAPLSLQRDFLTDAWRGLSAAGPAVARAGRLITTALTDPAQLPAVLAAVAWEEIPDAAKGPLIDQVLRACLTAARTVELPSPPGVPTGTILRHVAIGALERALGYPAGIKVRIADRMAQIILRPSPDFSIGFLSGLVAGLWDGLTGPFVLLWDLVKIGYEIQAAQLRLLATLADRQSRDALSRDVQATLDRVNAQLSTLLADLRAGRTEPRTILALIDRMVAAALRGVESLGASLSDALLRFLTRPDRQLGEGVGWVAGTATFEVLLLVLTEGGYTALKGAVGGLRAAIRLAEAGAAVAEALTPVRAALTAFRGFAAGNRALAPLVEAVEALLALLVRYLRFSYGLGPAGGAARAGERLGAAGERGAAREIRVAETAMRETHEITLLADGRLIRCSDRCLQLAESIAERGRALAAARMPEESARLAREAEQISAEARALAGNRGLGPAEREAREQALLRRAGSLERQTAAAEREALRRIVDPGRVRTAACRRIAADNPAVGALRQFDVQLTHLEGELDKCAELAFDPSMRGLVRDEVQRLAKEAAEVEEAMRRLAPARSGPAAAFDAAAFEASLVRLPAGERVARVGTEAERQAARHGFQRDRGLSALNNRDVYRDPTNGHLYSVDTQHGRFEHCAPNGNHLGEVKLDLTKVPNSQSADHSLTVG
ncbi:hypothetical protein [Actinoplanes sp. NPDC049599]|uniref:hypothetical protein n=1 Tax=Actinoplanes sp. NPDC049599 TaxID=3363903 RepID=UPI0037B3334C